LLCAPKYPLIHVILLLFAVDVSWDFSFEVWAVKKRLCVGDDVDAEEAFGKNVTRRSTANVLLLHGLPMTLRPIVDNVHTITIVALFDDF